MTLLRSIADFNDQTQLQILTAVVKLFLKRPDQAQGLVQKVLQAATAENDNPDIRDRAYVYWRLLSNTDDPNAAKNIVLSEKPPITTTIQSLPPALLDQLLNEISTLASVYHEPPEQFIGQGRFGADAVQKAAIEYALLINHACLTTELTMRQRTTSKCARKSPGGCCRCRCRLWCSTASAKQRRKSAGHRFRRYSASFSAERTTLRHVWTGRSRWYTAKSCESGCYVATIGE